jgi:hypothetical protein
MNQEERGLGHIVILALVTEPVNACQSGIGIFQLGLQELVLTDALRYERAMDFLFRRITGLVHHFEVRYDAPVQQYIGWAK